MVLFRPIISFNYKMSKNPFGRSVDTTRLVFHLLLLVLLLLFLLYIFEKKTKKWKKKKQTSSIVGRWTPLSVHFIYKHISTASLYVSFFFFFIDIVCVRRRLHPCIGQNWSTNKHTRTHTHSFITLCTDCIYGNCCKKSNNSAFESHQSGDMLFKEENVKSNTKKRSNWSERGTEKEDKANNASE